MSKFQYMKIVQNTSLSEEQLNKLGADGWEHYQSIGGAHFLKRQWSDNATPENPSVAEQQKTTEPQKGRRGRKPKQ